MKASFVPKAGSWATFRFRTPLPSRASAFAYAALPRDKFQGLTAERPAGQTEPGSFTASYRDPQAPSTTQRMGRRQYRSQQNSGAYGENRTPDAPNADKPNTPARDSDDFKSDANSDDFS